MYLILPKDMQNLLCSGSWMQLPALVSKVAFSCTNRSKKVRNPELRVEGTECLQASRCMLLLPEVSRGELPHSWGSSPLWSSFLLFFSLFPINRPFLKYLTHAECCARLWVILRETRKDGRKAPSESQVYSLAPEDFQCCQAKVL